MGGRRTSPIIEVSGERVLLDRRQVLRILSRIATELDGLDGVLRCTAFIVATPSEGKSSSAFDKAGVLVGAGRVSALFFDHPRPCL